ncbi:MAG: hypothetical protein EPN74_12775 [Rhodanobacter sp.]|nr:MAG: hypothetical protein EPN74_12775 [Rhodanobacter sp.]
MASKKRVVAADTLQGIETLQHVLGDMVDLITATSFAKAIRTFDEPIDMIICGIHFDDSRMFDLLAYTRNQTHLREIPFYIFRDLDSALEPTFFRSLEISAGVLGATGFIDLFALKQRFGVSNADEQFRKRIANAIELY